MRNSLAVLRYYRHAKLRSTAWSSGASRYMLFASRVNKDVGFLSSILQKRFSSTNFSSVHGERPSAEYAKKRKESLEDEFGHVLGAYSSRSVSVVYRFGPFLALFRAAVISFYVLKLSIWQLFVHDIRKRAAKFCETLIQLGPFYIKLGQALSTRPDILPTIYCQELSKLQDQIPPFPTSVAMRSIETQLGGPVSEIFADMSQEPIAAASLGQVYKVVQLICIQESWLLSRCRGLVRHMFEEIDYILEGENAERFASLYGTYSDGVDHGRNNNQATDRDYPTHKGHGLIRVPKIYWKYTRKAVLTMEWINGIKLTDEKKLAKVQLNRKELVDQGLYCSLRQLLEVGFFHADPHPGNLVATDDGSLAYFDFGMMGNIPRHYRVGLIQVLVHFVNRDALGLANDFLSLGFLPEGVDIILVSDALQTSFGDGTRQSRDFQSILNQLYDVMYEFNFSLPPDYALVIRALGSLEGTAKALDPDFKVVESAYPFVIGRLLADPSPDMRKILRELLIRNDGSIRWNRLERLIAAISEEASDSAEPRPNFEQESSIPVRWKSFDMRSVVAATEDLFLFILSGKGLRVRLHLTRDILKAADAFLLEEVVHKFNDDFYERKTSMSEEHTRRVVNGFQYLWQAVKKSPEAWIAMLARMAVKPEFHNFVLEIVSALMHHSSREIPENSWICLSKILHNMVHSSNSEDI
ncbi:uncharacterized protein LOC141605509 isoform X2 [Silene latifolia]|uniref:uncharacterized protein LOC141605509 isoform X2 n=1 Tax=Silene latifolia TaxID=37657 RepID=UPI003D778939